MVLDVPLRCGSGFEPRRHLRPSVDRPELHLAGSSRVRAARLVVALCRRRAVAGCDPARRPRRERLGRRLDRPAIRPGQSRSARSSTRWPTGFCCCRECSRLLIDDSIPRWYGILVLAREVVIAVSRSVWRRPAPRRIDVLWVGKAGTLLRDVLAARVPRRRHHHRVVPRSVASCSRGPVRSPRWS